MHPRERANLDVPADLRREITRYGGLNPFGGPSFRVVWAENVLDHSFGTMRHMPRVSSAIDERDVRELEPERFESGEFWTPRYSSRGVILERWFAGPIWGEQWVWEAELSEDGRRMQGEWPRHGDYYMVSDEFQPEIRTAGFWKEEIQRELRRQANTPTDPARYLAERLYIERAVEAARREAFLEEVNHIHRGGVEPMLATVGRTAQQVRDEIAAQMGFEGHLAAG